MSEFPEIDRFFDTYVDSIRNMFPALRDGYPEKIEGASQFIDEAFSISRSAEKPAFLRNIRELEIAIPRYYEVFLSAYTYRNLELPIVHFPATTAPADRLMSMVRTSEPCSLLAFASDENVDGSYCIDLTRDEAIVFHPAVSDVREPRIVLASSFLHLLTFLTEFIEWGANIDELDEADRMEALRELRDTDREGVGGEAWETWWRPRLTNR